MLRQMASIRVNVFRTSVSSQHRYSAQSADADVARRQHENSKNAHDGRQTETQE